ncbi:N-terminal phage integrase SAM-like domain-containing protein [Paenibacillus mendelii]|uniref:N-terminal phage integrase SAM-like domain-containing protein n=1 Tax=Paenibacillus mendelii TaxID=206163 RepID=A0ABV6JCL6_9BACL|nr:N-terminal phage integrase SAM-like domain-containing protein [Paenibacillus mendelii]MCQ6561531.1 N-terminal phage integrase SAM-like domain-containing protein [Paenibacillus mendelii]
MQELEKKTLSIYLRILNNRILPAIGHLRLDQVKPLHVASLISELGKEGTGKTGKMESFLREPFNTCTEY